MDVSAAYAFSNTNYRRDRYLDSDHAWGGGIEAKYFFHRYFALGIEGNAFDADRIRIEKKGFAFQGNFSGDKSRANVGRAVASVLGVVTARYPLLNTCLAPYAYAGLGAMFGGGERDIVKGRLTLDPETFSLFTEHTGSRIEPVGQFGAGIEFRLTSHIGVTNDFSWNVVNRRNNNFGTIRSGINFAF